MAYIELKNVYKYFKVGKNKIIANNDINLSIEQGELIIIVGASGAGKTTLLNMIGGMDTLSQGEIIVDKKELSNMNEKDLTRYRRDDVGFVFQFYNLIPNLTSIENVELASEIAKDNMDASKALDEVGLSNRKDSFPSQLSGGEQQRVAIARALINNPYVIFADEPTGALDSNTSTEIMEILKKLNEDNKTIIMVTHDEDLTKYANKIIRVKDGVITKGEDYVSN